MARGALRNPHLLRIGELAQASGMPLSTVRHYVNEGLLGAPARQSRNMAYYPRRALDRIALIKRLQDQLFLPLKMIRKLLAEYQELTIEDLDRVLAIRNRLAERHGDLLPEIADIPHSALRQLALGDDEIDALEQAGAVTPRHRDGTRYYDEVDYRVLTALSAVRSSGFGRELGTTDDLDIYLGALRRLVEVETRLFLQRARDRPIEEIIELIRRGLPAVNEVIGALHHKLLLEELAAQAPPRPIDVSPPVGRDREG
jgi:DNA-binding transcriptional MerR regulator